MTTYLNLELKPTKRSLALERLKAMTASEDELGLIDAQLLDLLDQSRVVDRNGFLIEPTRVWEPATPFKVGDYVVPTTITGTAYRCVTAGTSGNTEPAWSANVNDGSAVWVSDATYGAWTPTYDLNYAASLAWELKAAIAATRISFTSEGARFDRDQYIANCQAMRAMYVNKIAWSARC